MMFIRSPTWMATSLATAIRCALICLPDTSSCEVGAGGDESVSKMSPKSSRTRCQVRVLGPHVYGLRRRLASKAVVKGDSVRS